MKLERILFLVMIYLFLGSGGLVANPPGIEEAGGVLKVKHPKVSLVREDNDWVFVFSGDQNLNYGMQVIDCQLSGIHVKKWPETLLFWVIKGGEERSFVPQHIREDVLRALSSPEDYLEDTGWLWRVSLPKSV